MLEIKNATELKKMNNVVNNNIMKINSQLKEAESELKLLNSVERSSKWFKELLPILQELHSNTDNTGILKTIISYTTVINAHVEGLIGFDEGWITSIQIKILSTRRKCIPDTFHKHVHHRNWYYDIYALKDKYPTACINTHKVDKISLIGQALESLNAWCLHRLYTLEENPRFCR